MNSKEKKFVFLIIIIFIAAGLETDIYLPALADMMSFFQQDEAHIQQLLTWNFISICLACPFYGPLADIYGRRMPILIALGLFLIGSILTVASGSLSGMLWGRVLQGLGSAGCFTLGTAIIFDIFQNDRAIFALNWINSIFPFILAGAPMLGGYLNNHFGFRANFIAVACLVLISFLITLCFFKETLPQDKRQTWQWTKLWQDIQTISTSSSFLLLVFILSLLFSMWMAFFSTISILFVLELGVSKQAFQWFQCAPLLAWLIASLSANHVLKQLGTQGMKHMGAILSMIGSISFITGASIASKNPYIHIITMCFYAFGINWFQSVYFPEMMQIHPEIKGIASSLFTSIRLLVTASMVAIVSNNYNHTIYPVVVAMLIMLLITIPMLYCYEKKRIFIGYR